MAERAPRLARGPAATVVPAVLGSTAVACGAGMLACAAVGATGDGRAVADFAIAGAISAIAGAAALRIALKRPSKLTVPASLGFATVTLAWVAATLIGAVPLLTAGTFDSLLDAGFEAMSGFTTTGATLVGSIETQPDAVLLWRSIMQWLGGIGIVVLVVAVAPLSGEGLQRVFYAETSGIGPERLTPRITNTAKIVSAIYGSLTAACALAFLLAGMGSFDAVNHAMTTLATGGFSTRAASIASFDSLAVEIVAIVFMLAAGINFALYWRAVKRRPLMPQLAEARAYLLIVAAAVVAIGLSLELGPDPPGLGRALRDAAFTVASISSTTGFTTADFDIWHGFARYSLILLMVVGACAGSTAGGIKVIRFVLLAKSARDEVRRQVYPTRVRVLRLGGRAFGEDTRAAVLGFFAVYAVVFAAGVLAFSATGLGTDSSISGTAATLNVIGPGLGDLGALENFEALNDPARGIAITLMLIGRLEVFTVVALLSVVVGRVRGQSV